MSLNPTAPRRPALRYHGGKWLLARWISRHFPPHEVYVEPFGGGGSVLLRKERAPAEVYNELDGEVTNVFRVLREPLLAEALRRAVHLTPFSRAEFDRALDPAPADDPVERARRTLARVFLARGVEASRGTATGFRAVSLRPGGQHAATDWANYPDAVPAFVERLRGVVIEERDALEVIAAHDGPRTLFYVDPPYPHATRRADLVGRRDRGYRHELSDDGHRTLARALRAAAGMVVLSGYPCDLYDRELYPDWRRAQRVCAADGAGTRTEVLWLNPAASRHHAAELALDRAQDRLLFS